MTAVAKDGSGGQWGSHIEGKQCTAERRGDDEPDRQRIGEQNGDGPPVVDPAQAGEVSPGWVMGAMVSLTPRQPSITGEYR